jgi:hypothetical protein
MGACSEFTRKETRQGGGQSGMRQPGLVSSFSTAYAASGLGDKSQAGGRGQPKGQQRVLFTLADLAIGQNVPSMEPLWMAYGQPRGLRWAMI